VSGYRTDGLNPVWSRDGRYVAFDSTHDGHGWQVYFAGVHELGVSMVPSDRDRFRLPDDGTR
jgi:Tol biopolymer transport system component